MSRSCMSRLLDCKCRNVNTKTTLNISPGQMSNGTKKGNTEKSTQENVCEHGMYMSLCCGVYDPKHTKNIYHKANVKLLALAETVFGDKLLNEDYLPRLLCRPCERKLDNFSKFKNMVCENQTSMMKKKRCLNISPSAPITEGKRAKTNIGEKSPASRRGLSFTFDKEVTQSEVCSISQLMRP